MPDATTPPPAPTRFAAFRRRVRRALLYIGRRGAFLAFLAVLDVIVGRSLIDTLPFGLTAELVYAPFVAIMPITWWAAWWILTAAAAAAAAFIQRLRTAVFGCCALIKVAWGAGYLYGWSSDEPAFTRGYQTATIFFFFALIVVLISGWRENGR